MADKHTLYCETILGDEEPPQHLANPHSEAGESAIFLTGRACPRRLPPALSQGLQDAVSEEGTEIVSLWSIICHL